MNEEERERRKEIARQAKIDRYKSRLEDKGVGREYCEKTVDDYALLKGKDKELFLKYLHNLEAVSQKGIGMFLYGSPGTGKTGLMMEVAKKALSDDFVTISIYTFPELVEAYLGKYRNEDYASIWDNALGVSILGIDDIMKESVHEREKSRAILDVILRRRQAMMRPVILTANSNIDEVQNWYGEYIGSLLKNIGVVINLVGKDYREVLLRDKHKFVDALSFSG